MRRLPHPPRCVQLDVRIGRSHQLHLFERPGLWMEAGERDALLADLRTVADRCAGPDVLRYGVLSGAPGMLERALIALLVRRDSGEPIGFNAMFLLDVELGGRCQRILHTGLSMLVPRHRRAGLSLALYGAPALLAFARNRFRRLWVTNVSQVPAAIGMFAHNLHDVVPAPGVRPALRIPHRDIATALMAEHRAVFGVGADAVFDPERFVIRNAYTGGSDGLKKPFSACAAHRDSTVNHYCQEHLDYERGDDFLQVGSLSLPRAGLLSLRLLRGLLRRAHRSARRGVAPFSLPAVARVHRPSGVAR
ncbi:MAG: hypothetical protein R3E10_15760 [Gemmatimonadota bacterium]